MDRLTDGLLAYMGTFQDVVAEGAVDEKRSFIRAFVSRLDIDPRTARSSVGLIRLSNMA